jgi:hypothetical protein
MLNLEQLLTPEESAQVDGAIANNKEKFAVRVAIYGLRVLQQIGAEQGMALEAIGATELRWFLDADQAAQQAITQNGFAIDEPFKAFWSQIILSSLKPLHQAAAAEGVALEALSVGQIIAWFEAQASNAPD